jgi:hypothetical protein
MGEGGSSTTALGLVSFTFMQVRLAIAPPSRSSRSSITTTDTGESEDEDNSERQPDTTGGDPVEQVHQRYVTGEIGELALETELEDALRKTRTEDTSQKAANEGQGAHK